MRDRDEQRRKIVTIKNGSNQFFCVFKTSLKHKQDQLRPKSAFGRRKLKRFHDFPGRRDIALRSISFRKFGGKLEVVRRDCPCPIKHRTRSIETTQSAQPTA